MSWFDKLRTYLGHDEIVLFDPRASDPQEAVRAYESAKQALGEARHRQEETKKIGMLLADLNERNHYGESIMLSMLPKERRS